MHAWAVVESGASLQRIERPTPEPTGTEVLIEVTHCGVCHSDLHIWDGYYDLGGGKRLSMRDRGMVLPLAMGHEVVGRVAKLGPLASGVAVGDLRIVYPWVGCGTCERCLAEEDNMCPNLRSIGIYQHGGYATHVVAPHPRHLIDPGALDPALAATYACSGITVFSAIRKAMPLRPDQPIVLVGAGGLGLNAIHVLRALGHANIVVVDLGADKRQAALDAGATAAVDGAGEGVTARILAGEGDLLPVSAMPVDGTFPTGTTRYEKRALAQEIPIWDPDICIDCGKCAIVCPHNAMGMKVLSPDDLDGAPDTFATKSFNSRELATPHLLSIQVSPDDCTGCGVCVEQCPAISKSVVGHKSINMEPIAEHRDRERDNYAFFDTIPLLDRGLLPHDTVKGSQVLQPLFEFSSACEGCGETPYLRLLSQLFGDRMIVANATGCSSIYGGNLPTTPWSRNAEGRGPAWSNSLFEDNAEFGLGMRLGKEQGRATARALVGTLADAVGPDLARELLDADQSDEAGVSAQRERVARLRERLDTLGDDSTARHLASLADDLVRTDVWIIGGDGWAYDIGYGGLDHVLASGENVNVLVLDTEVYSNTGGQASKATPRGAVAKFATSGKATPKKDLGALAMQYGNVYVAQIALGANEVQTVRALQEAAAWQGPSLVLAYSTCIAHGIDMKYSMTHMRDAVKSGHWPLYRFAPGPEEHTKPFRLDSRKPALALSDFAREEGRFAMLERSDPERAHHLMALAQADVDERWHYYEQLAGVERSVPHEPGAVVDPEGVATEEVST